jgi:phage-related protein
MPAVEVVFFADEDGSAPALEWLGGVPEAVQDRFIVRAERLAEHGSDLRRPEADLLRNGIYELRVRHRRINYRILYFFQGQRAVLCYGLTKEKEVADQDIERAIGRRGAFIGNPEKHTFTEE